MTGKGREKSPHKFNELADSVAYLQLFMSGGACSLRSCSVQNRSVLLRGLLQFQAEMLCLISVELKYLKLVNSGFALVSTQLSWGLDFCCVCFCFSLRDRERESAAALRGNRKDAPPLPNCFRTHCVTVS